MKKLRQPEHLPFAPFFRRSLTRVKSVHLLFLEVMCREKRAPVLKVKIVFLILLSVVLPCCKRATPYRGPKIEKPLATAYSNHPAGSGLLDLIDDFKLDHAEVRYRAGLPDSRKSALYFMEEGNLHVEAMLNENGEWVLISTPYLEPSSIPAPDRLSKWDAAVESDNSPPDGKR